MKVRLSRTLAVCALAAAVVLAAGCGSKKPVAVEPKIAPPAIAKAGVLAAGVDLSQPPFAGVDGGRRAGMDVDVAAALADKLGVKVTYVDVKPSEAASALAEGKVDCVLSVSLADASLSRVTIAGTYADDAPAFFVSREGTASVEPSITLDSLNVPVVAAQQGSPAFWALQSELGSEGVKPYESIRAALEDLDAGDVELVAGDAFVGSYIARDLPTVRYAGQLATATPLGVAVAADNVALQDAVREALDTMAADGLLDAIRRKWVGELPELRVDRGEESTTTP